MSRIISLSITLIFLASLAILTTCQLKVGAYRRRGACHRFQQTLKDSYLCRIRIEQSEFRHFTRNKGIQVDDPAGDPPVDRETGG